MLVGNWAREAIAGVDNVLFRGWLRRSATFDELTTRWPMASAVALARLGPVLGSRSQAIAVAYNAALLSPFMAGDPALSRRRVPSSLRVVRADSPCRTFGQSRGKPRYGASRDCVCVMSRSHPASPPSTAALTFGHTDSTIAAWSGVAYQASLSLSRSGGAARYLVARLRKRR
jgi:hypothetical protein